MGPTEWQPTVRSQVGLRIYISRLRNSPIRRGRTRLPDSTPQPSAVTWRGATFEDFFADARLNPHASSITGVVCGVRYLDKLVDELARGKSRDKILRG